MKIFLAGATGAVGRPLVQRLVGAGHEVVGLTRRDDRARWLVEHGAAAVVGDAMDGEWLRDAVCEASPEVVIDQMTDLPQRIRMRGMGRFYRGQNPLRVRGSAALLDGARAAGARRIIAQSVAFIYAPGPGGPRTETAPTWADAPEPFGNAIRVAVAHDQSVGNAADIEGVVLRYGVFYGPGTHYSPGNGQYEDIRRRRQPIVGDGASVWSFVHVDDAAEATVRAIEADAPPGVYNIVDDDPAPVADWLPALAGALGAKPPRKVPVWLARLVAGPFSVMAMTQLQAASNVKAKQQLGWSPAIASWREGFRTAL